MSPKRKKVETALKNLFSNKNPAEGEASASTQPEKEPEIKSTELLEETNPEPPKPKTRRTTKKETVPQSEKTEQPEPVKEETTVLKTETKIAVRPETNLEAPMVKQSVETAVQPPQQEIKTSPVPEVTGSRITSYNVCYTKLLREVLTIQVNWFGAMLLAKQLRFRELSLYQQQL